VIKNRLAQYREKTEPLIDYYEDRGILNHVDGERSPDEVEERIHGIIATLRREDEMEI
jgi:adenylate kinase